MPTSDKLEDFMPCNDLLNLVGKSAHLFVTPILSASRTIKLPIKSTQNLPKFIVMWKIGPLA